MRHGFLVYERFRAEVKRLQKNPDGRVRAAALHVKQDAYGIEEIEEGLDRAAKQGWRAVISSRFAGPGRLG